MSDSPKLDRFTLASSTMSDSSCRETFSINPIFVKKPNDNRPYLYVKIADVSVLALVDTGSNVSILGSQGLSILRSLNIPIKYNNAVSVTTADGKLQEVFGNASLSVTLHSVTKCLTLLVIPSVTHTLILGMDFLQSFGITMDIVNFSFTTQFSNCSTVNTIQNVSHLSLEQKNQLNEIIDLFHTLAPADRLGRTHLITHTIDTGDSKPIKQRQYPLSPAMQTHLIKEIDSMLSQGIIQPSKSAWCSPLWLVTKSSGEYRICFDGRKLNQVTVEDAYPMPNIDSILSKLRDARFLTSIDLKSAFHQIPLDPSSRPKTAFAIPGKGLFEFSVMPFGLANSPKTMVRLMDMVIGPSLEPFVFVYLDDIIVATPDFPTHLQVLRTVFERLKEANLTINLKKCEFCRQSLKYLGFVVDNQGLRTDEGKVAAITQFPVPKTTTEIKRLLGLVGWYRRFIKDFSTISTPINNLLHGRKKGQPITWTPEADEAFQEIKRLLSTAPVLASPDFSKTFHLQCDGSNTGVGSVLYQEEDGIEHPIAYFSKTLNKAQRKYTTTEIELLSVLLSIEHFRKYIEGTHFIVETDHSSLTWLYKLSNPSGRLARWAVQLSQYNFTIVHRKGSSNVVPDSLSRAPIPNSTEELAVLDLSTLKPDKWYENMIVRVQENPEAYPAFKVSNNILFKHCFSDIPLESNRTDWKIVVPTSNRSEILHRYHDDETAGHLGISKTFSRISELYYWPKLRQDVRRYVLKCTICSANKSPNLPQAGQMGSYKNINFPFQLISMDLLGPYPRSKQGNQYLLVIVDWFTKYVLVHPLSKATTKAIIKFLENNVFLIYGVPQICVCDNGSQFISREFKNFMDSYKVQKIWYNAKYHPQINHAERVNKVIVTSIRSYISNNHQTWDMSIHKVAQAIRLAKHDVTGYPPSFLVFSRNIPLTGDYYGKISENSDNLLEIGNKLQTLEDIQELPKLYSDVRRRLRQAYDRSAKQYNRGKRSITFCVGDRVWKKNFTLSNAAQHYSAKLAPKYIPCTVRKVISNLVYVLQDDEGRDIGAWHVKDLKPVFPDSGEPTSDLDTDTSETSDAE